MKTAKTDKPGTNATLNAQSSLTKVAAAKKAAAAARKKVQLAKARLKAARKAFKSAKKSAKEARKEAKVEAKALRTIAKAVTARPKEPARGAKSGKVAAKRDSQPLPTPPVSERPLPEGAENIVP